MINRLNAVKNFITDSFWSARMSLRDRIYDVQVKVSKRERANYERVKARFGVDW